AEFSVVVDSSLTEPTNQSVRDFAFCSAADDRGLFGQKVLLQRVEQRGDSTPAPRTFSSPIQRPCGVPAAASLDTRWSSTFWPNSPRSSAAE
ncbi:hypothetical protein DN508_31400, partial [Burkholderia multivorans]